MALVLRVKDMCCLFFPLLWEFPGKDVNFGRIDQAAGGQDRRHQEKKISLLLPDGGILTSANGLTINPSISMDPLKAQDRNIGEASRSKAYRSEAALESQSHIPIRTASLRRPQQ
jgi:hypothetical protein